ncbi:IS1 family transposase, partial [Escherichia coli]
MATVTVHCPRCNSDEVYRHVNRPGFPGECFVCELRLPDHCFRWKH